MILVHVFFKAFFSLSTIFFHLWQFYVQDRFYKLRVFFQSACFFLLAAISSNNLSNIQFRCWILYRITVRFFFASCTNALTDPQTSVSMNGHSFWLNNFSHYNQNQPRGGQAIVFKWYPWLYGRYSMKTQLIYIRFWWMWILHQVSYNVWVVNKWHVEIEAIRYHKWKLNLNHLN